MMEFLKINLNKVVSLFILLSFAFNVLSDVGIFPNLERDNHSKILMESQSVQPSLTKADQGDHNKDNCCDLCHVGTCHFGHCGHVLISEHSYKHHDISLVYALANDSAPSVPSLKNLKRPPRLS